MSIKKSKEEIRERQREPQQKKVVINVERYQHLIEALDDNQKVLRIGISVIFIGAFMFAAITILVLCLKSFFPYSDISTSALGTTTIRDEQKQVSYFLFNTADLWAKSGIHVNEGDIISIHSSGSANTAIHHIDKASNENKKRERNFGPLGEVTEIENVRDRLRSHYRIFPKYPQGALVMQVVHGENISDLPNPNTDEDFYYIGAQRNNIHIVNEGYLHFAVNDIILDKATILKMMLDNIAVMAELCSRKGNQKEASLIYRSVYSHLKNPFISAAAYKNDTLIVESAIKMDTIYRDNISLLQLKNNNLSILKNAYESLISQPDFQKIYMDYISNDSTFKFGGYEKKAFDASNGNTKTEMDYYYEKGYKQAWFDDNVGSFLVIIEKDNRNRLSHGE